VADAANESRPSMLYHAYEWTHAAITPWRQFAKMSADTLRDPRNPWADSYGARTTAAAFEMFDSATARYGRPDFGIDLIDINGNPCAIREEIVMEKPFARLKRFRRFGNGVEEGKDPKILLIAPMSGHYATLLRGTVTAMLPGHDVYITDWRDARNVPVIDGAFDLEDYVQYLIEFLQELGPDTHVMGVCQPGVPALAAAALMAEDNDPCRPKSLVLTGSPIDTRISPTEPTKLAEQRSLAWFEANMIALVPMPHAGAMRRVYPGFLQLTGFMSMNMDRHMTAAFSQFENLVKGDDDAEAAHRKFYDEYLAVMDLTAEFYLQTIDAVFQRHLLPKGEFTVKGRRVNPSAISDIALMTIEGGKDDITGTGQTHAAHTLCDHLPDGMKLEYTNPYVGHYGTFNGGRWRNVIQPKVAKFIENHRG